MNISIFIGIILVVILNNLKHKIIASKSFFLVFIMGFLTTLPHEIAHFIIALILGGRPKGISIIPKKVEVGEYVYWTFGSVEAYTNSFSGFFIGIAPALWLIAGYFTAEYYFYYFPADFWYIILFFFIEWIFIENGIPSKEDLRIAFKSITGMLFFIFILFGAYYANVLNFNLPYLS